MSQSVLYGIRKPCELGRLRRRRLLLLNPGIIVIGQDGQGGNQFIGGQFSQTAHIKPSLRLEFTHRGAVCRLVSRSLRDRHFVLRQDNCPHLRGLLVVAGGDHCVYGHAVPHGELHLAAIHHIQALEFSVSRLRRKHRAAAEDGRAIMRGHLQFWLEEPGRVLVGVGLRLVVDQEKRHQTRAVRQKP